MIDETVTGLLLGLAVAPKPKAAMTNAHADPSKPPTLSELNGKIASASVKYGSTDRTHHIELVIKSGLANDIQPNEVLCRVSFGSRYVSPLQTIGIPAQPQIAAFDALNQTAEGYRLVSSGLPNGTVISVRAIVVESTESA